MTDLQLALLALGALIILTVVAFNWWQERKIRKEAAERFDEPMQDALMNDFHVDANSMVDDEPASEKFSVPVVASEDEPFPPTIPQLTDEIPDYEHSINQAVSAVAEFEKDMAVPVPEMEVSFSDEPMWENEAPKPTPLEKATTLELMEEAGLDKQVGHSSPANNAEASGKHAENQPISQHEPISLPANINPQIDLIAMLYLTQQATGNALCELLLPLADIDKPIYAYGLGLDGAWHMLTGEQGQVAFVRAACSLQFADRAGPVSPESLARFQQAIDNTGRKLGAQVEWQANIDPLRYAGELDQFCIEVDKMVGFHLAQDVSGPFTGTKLRGLAEASGLVLRENGAFHYESETGQTLFSVVNHDNNPFTMEMLRTNVIRGITFQLDIPHVRNCPEVFNQMVLIARQMEGSLSGQLVDDNQRTLGEAQIEKIRQQLKVIHAKMVARGIVPGSPIALRLFS